MRVRQKKDSLEGICNTGHIEEESSHSLRFEVRRKYTALLATGSRFGILFFLVLVISWLDLDATSDIVTISRS